MKSGFLNIISELMSANFFLYPNLEAELESMLRPYDAFEKLLWQFLKKMPFSFFKLRSNQKEIEDFIQSLKILEDPITSPLTMFAAI